MVTWVSQCDKKALNRTRRVLDSFANRIGDNTWQTIITQEGLIAVKKLLRKTATKNTAVSCHWVRGRTRSELLWIVGKRERFNDEGHVAVNRSKKRLPSLQSESDWHYLPLIKALTAMSALLHDWGKASLLFQAKLKPSKEKQFKGDPIRHEWISFLLLNRVVHATDAKDDQGWLSVLVKGEWDEALLTQPLKEEATQSLTGLPPIAQLLAWLIISHHRLPLEKKSVQDLRSSWLGSPANHVDEMMARITQVWGYENRFEEADYQARLNDCFTFPHGLMTDSPRWVKEVKKWSQRLLVEQANVETVMNNGSFRLILHHARLCLMLGDHHYSSQEACKKWQETAGLYANTDNNRQLKQKLDEHLVGVEKSALHICHHLPAFESEPPHVKDVRVLQKASPAAFAWQDKAVTAIKEWRTAQKKGDVQGFFAVNMASTGKGKTFANAKIMRALSDDAKSLRYILALGLRTLTLQTGDEYRERIGLDNSELAVLIGSRAVQALHEQSKNTDTDLPEYKRSGSESQEALLDEAIDFDVDLPEEGLSTVLKQQRDRQFLYAPILSCTIDHLMAATETQRGGRYILPSLRLMSSDLVIDEIDDFTGDDLIAIGRLIHLAGMLGRKVMISSATIPPDLAEGYFNAYREGWLLYAKTRDAKNGIGCAWVDEFSTQVVTNNRDTVNDAVLGDYRKAHDSFINKRVAKLGKEPAKRKAKIVPCQFIIDTHKKQRAASEETVESKQQAYFRTMADTAVDLHAHHHTVDDITGITVSLGVIRMANISPCVALTRYLLNHTWPEQTEVRVMAYHSQQILLMRHEQERHLDQVLKRKEKAGTQPVALSNAIIRQHLTDINASETPVKNVLFIVVATPVEEVGRDHDFDWAVVEPSSYRSIVQLAGRVRRHRTGAVASPNVALMQYNWKGVRDAHKENNPVFTRPGFEGGSQFLLKNHNLDALMDEQAIAECLDATPRIQKPAREDFRMRENLAHLEHAQTKWLLTMPITEDTKGPEKIQGYLRGYWYLSALPQKLTPFRQSEASVKLFLLWDDNKEAYCFHERNQEGDFINRQRFLCIRHSDLTEDEKKRLWLVRDYTGSITRMAEAQDRSRFAMAIRYGELSFTQRANKNYVYNDQLGMVYE